MAAAKNDYYRVHKRDMKRIARLGRENQLFDTILLKGSDGTYTPESEGVVWITFKRKKKHAR